MLGLSLAAMLSSPQFLFRDAELEADPAAKGGWRLDPYAKASQLAHFLIEVTKAFGAFYRECHVLGDDRELTQARLMLVESTRRVLAQGLTLLGIPLPERM
jgi:hypothetical protein